MRSAPVARSISTRTSVPHSDVKTVPIRLKSVGGNLTLVRSRRANLPAPLRTASASISAVHACPATVNVACDHAQREKLCVIAPVTKLRACAHAATAGSASGASPGMIELPVFPARLRPLPALGSVGAMPHNSSAAGHSPNRNTTRAASAAACVPTWAPIEALVAELISGTQRGLRWAASCVAWSMV